MTIPNERGRAQCLCRCCCRCRLVLVAVVLLLAPLVVWLLPSCSALHTPSKFRPGASFGELFPNDAYRKYHQLTQQGEIGMVIWFRWFEPLSNSTIDLDAAQRATDFTVGWFLDPVLYGDYPAVMREVVGSRLPIFTEEQSESLRGSVDFIGLNAVTAIYATYDDEYKTDITGYFQDWSAKLTAYKDGVAIGKSDGEYSVPWCMEKIVSYMRTHYNNFPTYITALGWGMSDTSLDDVDRVEFYATYLKSLIKGIRDGANVQGMFVWSLVDGFETALGLETRFGIHYVDENFDRYARLSALWFKYVLSQNDTIAISVSGGNQHIGEE